MWLVHAHTIHDFSVAVTRYSIEDEKKNSARKKNRALVVLDSVHLISNCYRSDPTAAEAIGRAHRVREVAESRNPCTVCRPTGICVQCSGI